MSPESHAELILDIAGNNAMRLSDNPRTAEIRVPHTSGSSPDRFIDLSAIEVQMKFMVSR